MIVVRIRREEVINFWPIVYPYIKEACRRSSEDPGDLLRELLRKPEYFLVIFILDGSIIGSCIFSIEPDRVHLVSMSGDLPKGWQDILQAYFVKIAKSAGLDSITIDGRKGWQRMLLKYGWKLNKHGVLEYRINGKQEQK